MKKLLILIAALFPFAASAEDDHLAPEESVFSRGKWPDPVFSIGDNEPYDPDPYYKSVLAVLKGAYERDIFGRVIVLPSFQNEYATAVSRKDGKYKIIYLYPDTFIWRMHSLKMYKTNENQAHDDYDNSASDKRIEQLEAELPASIEDVRVEKCEIDIDEALGDALYALWAEMLFRTRYIDRRPVTPDGDHRTPVGLDGVSYHFSFDYGSERLTGATWSPDEDSITGKFVAIAKMMRSACETKNTGLFAKMQYDAEQLLAALAQSDY